MYLIKFTQVSLSNDSATIKFNINFIFLFILSLIFAVYKGSFRQFLAAMQLEFD